MTDEAVKPPAPAKSVRSRSMSPRRELDEVRRAHAHGGATAAAVAETARGRRALRPSIDPGLLSVNAVLHLADVNPSQFAEALAQVLQVLDRPAAVDPADHLSSHELERLRSAGLDMRPAELEESSGFPQAAAAQAALVAESLTTKEVAELLQTTQEDVLARTARGDLYRFVWQGDDRFPKFQFDGGQVAGGLPEVLRRLPSDISPFVVWRWFVEPNDALDPITPISPIEWLHRSNPPEQLYELAETLLAI